MKPTASQVWKTMLENPEFVDQAPEGSPGRDAIRPFIEGSVEVLADQLDTVVNLQAIANAKLTFLRYCVENGLIKAMGDATGMGGAFFSGLFDGLIDMLEPIVANTTSFLEENRVTEEQLMVSPQVGLNAESQEKWRAGTLTIGELLMTQPSVILMNN